MVLRIIGGIALLIALFYFGVLVTTSVRFVNTDSYGFVLTKDPKIKDGRIPTGTLALAQIGVGDSKLSTIGGKLELAVLPQSGVSGVTVIGGPDGRLTYDGDYIAYNGKATRIHKSASPDNFPNKGYLDGKYWVSCADKHSACQYGKTYVIDAGDIIGQVHEPTDKTVSELWGDVKATADQQGKDNKSKLDANDKAAENQQKTGSPIENQAVSPSASSE